MKPLPILLLTTTAGFAVAIGETPDDGHDHAAQTASCCGGDSTTIRSSYLIPVLPEAAQDVTGTVKGNVLFGGKERPKIEPLEISAKAAEGCTADGQSVDDTNWSVIIAKGGGIKNAVVQLDVEGAENKELTEPIVLDQAQCRYDPHVLLIPAGATVEYLNSDSVSHNVHTYSLKNTPFNRTIGAGGKDRQKLDKPEAIEAKCDIHPWMNCWLYVTDKPFTTTTGADGTFTIEGVPAGTHKATIWHERLGKARAEVTVAEDGSSAALEVKLSGKKTSGRRRRR
ncbi:MAG: carboxypeptidase regulatory-like domain-containing protein [Planctomycetota bacterium]|jgi:plastocyanin|nr:carboxypeptidase regulatory-like domain-containing protein [Planctomycetota bacterium]MDP6762783.1 carboxypeptidase regulatory-like domain-containing protein [Planctomycetota bacterium]